MCSKCQQIFSRKHILLKDKDIMLHMIYKTILYDMKIAMLVFLNSVQHYIECMTNKQMIANTNFVSPTLI